MRFRSLGSGSSGNATLVEATSGTLVTRLLIDCGMGLRQLDARLETVGLLAEQIDAIFITHEHSDHVGCALPLSLRHRIPVWMSQGTHSAIGAPDFDGLLRIASDADTIDLGAIEITPFTVPHDAREPLQLTCSNGDRRLGVLTDLGHASAHVLQHLSNCHALLLECNHDRPMLAASRYPDFLKRRVGGPYGHLANEAAAAIVRSVMHQGLGHVVAAHLSLQNNRPGLAQLALANALGRSACDITTADALRGTEWISV